LPPKKEPREDWTAVYYHRADEKGIGFDRTRSGSGAIDQYFSPLRERFADLKACPENLLLWFHHVSRRNTSATRSTSSPLSRVILPGAKVKLLALLAARLPDRPNQ
jgi:alpha-glucuronidase